MNWPRNKSNGCSLNFLTNFYSSKIKLLDVFFAHVDMVKQAGISYTIEVTANDETIPFLEEMNGLCEIHTGAKPHIIESRDMNNGFQKLTKLSNEEHMRTWAGNESPLIEFQDSIWGEYRKEFCYAGDWIAILYLESGCPSALVVAPVFRIFLRALMNQSIFMHLAATVCGSIVMLPMCC